MIQQTYTTFRAILAIGLIGIICGGTFSCSSPADAGKIEGEAPFFDLQAYFQSEIERLNAAAPLLEKQVAYNKKTETLSSSENDFAKELKLFEDSDINRPAWTDKYQIDSLLSGNQLEQLTYSALDSSLRIRSIQIDYREGELAQVKIYKKQESFVGRSRQQLTYAPQEGYRIQSFQKTILMPARELAIEADFR